jgi:hypothetical protein
MVMQLHCPGEGVSRRVQGRIPPVGDGQAPAVVMMMSTASPLTPQLRWLAPAAAWAQRGNPQRPPQDSLDRLEAGFEQQKRILFWLAERTFRCDGPAERRGSSRKHGHGLGAESGAATGPIPVGA